MNISCFLNSSLKSTFKGALILSTGAFSFTSYGKVINATSLSQSSVQTAINSASPGDTIQLPAESSSWSGQLSITKKDLTIQGKGIGSTIISAGNKSIYLSGESANGLRITGIEFRNGNQVIYSAGSGSPRQAIKNLRIDHCKLQGNYIFIETTGAATGVFDHNTFLDSYAARLYGSNDPVARPPYPLGTSDALFFEDNTISVTSGGNPPHWIASNSHSKYVVRYNTFDYKKSLWDIIDAHGACEVKGRGSATWEIYNNKIGLVPTISRVIHLRGGQGVVFNNTFTGYNPSKAITITDYAVCNGPCTQSCTSYPCPDMINHAYFWNNRIGTTPVNPVNNCSNYIKLDRDYFNSEMPDYKPYTYPHPLTQPEEDFKTETINEISHSGFSLSASMLRGSASISLQMSEQAPVKVTVYSANGILVKELANQVKSAGTHSFSWDAADNPSGIYIIKASVGEAQKSFKLFR
ncbi:MAG: T9SS type A sorting domain-containing protein [Fibrobacter sp.]|nr:T9SS type A sorting domain-containing protein [Fibrobacter sp.]